MKRFDFRISVRDKIINKESKIKIDRAKKILLHKLKVKLKDKGVREGKRKLTKFKKNTPCTKKMKSLTMTKTWKIFRKNLLKKNQRIQIPWMEVVCQVKDRIEEERRDKMP